ncbi:hypothetical protein [Pontiella sulfatireligans]|uniref:Uncharacterized protein n=1 Tax=Pontiella sulfatireligans TaxID=2750658 RepID=A0A6C2UWN6_9BACT|nr:hypothetical protein [Pontiella sulfatireligans]VGO23256.1 hypothetical protein SCARR_05363 [Pontiella sulfatireligans]
MPQMFVRNAIVALIDEREVIERILCYLSLWEEGTRLNPARAPSTGEGMMELFPEDPFPDYPVTTVVTWQHGTGYGLRPLRERLSVRDRGGLSITRLIC